MNTQQYSVNGDMFIPAEATQIGMPAGIYSVGTAPGVGMFFSKKSVTKDSLVRLPEKATTTILDEIQKFWDRREHFQRYGLVHKRGILMHGPPGSGKTSTLATVVDDLVRTKDGIVLYASGHLGLITSGLRHIRRVTPDRKIVVIMEDVDNLINNYGEDQILPLLDGENSVDGVVFIATTNYLDQLPDRIKNRPSRFDSVIEVGMPSAESRRVYLKSRNLGLTDDELEKWVASTNNFSIAQLKEVLVSVLALGNDFNETIERVGKMVPSTGGRSSDLRSFTDMLDVMRDRLAQAEPNYDPDDDLN